MSTKGAPTVTAMKLEEARKLLARNHVGRLAYSWHDRVNIAPLNYVFDEDWIFARTGPGEKLTLVKHNPWVAFEVDEVRGLFDWSSVVAIGTVTLLTVDGPPADGKRLERARELLGDLIPGAFSSEDPVPGRSVVLGIAISELSGRVALPADR